MTLYLLPWCSEENHTVPKVGIFINLGSPNWENHPFLTPTSSYFKLLTFFLKFLSSPLLAHSNRTTSIFREKQSNKVRILSTFCLIQIHLSSHLSGSRMRNQNLLSIVLQAPHSISVLLTLVSFPFSTVLAHSRC